jgi:hypothetical protein
MEPCIGRRPTTITDHGAMDRRRLADPSRLPARRMGTRAGTGHTTAKAVAAIKAKTAERQVDESPVDLKPER